MLPVIPDKIDAQNPEKLVKFFKECIYTKQYSKAYYVLGKDFQDLVPQAMFIQFLDGTPTIVELIESLGVKDYAKSESDNDDNMELFVISDKFGISFRIKSEKLSGLKSWVFLIDQEKFNELADKFWKWYDLQLQSAQWQRQIYPPDWNYQMLKK